MDKGLLGISGMIPEVPTIRARNPQIYRQCLGIWRKSAENSSRIDLIGGFNPTHLENMKVSWDDDIPNIWKNIEMFQSPLTSHGLMIDD